LFCRLRGFERFRSQVSVVLSLPDLYDAGNLCLIFLFSIIFQ